MRLIATFNSPNNGNTCATRVYRNSEWNEYVVKYYLGGVHMPLSDYHTDDKADAISSAKIFVGALDLAAA